jgi:hypothetical protein
VIEPGQPGGDERDSGAKDVEIHYFLLGHGWDSLNRGLPLRRGSRSASPWTSTALVCRRSKRTKASVWRGGLARFKRATSWCATPAAPSACRLRPEDDVFLRPLNVVESGLSGWPLPRQRRH